MPSITAQSMPFRCAAALRFEANFGDRRSAGGVGSGSGEVSQIVAALSGPSISGFGAGFDCGSRTLRSWIHCERGSEPFALEREPFLPLDAAGAPAELGADACPDDS